MHSDRGFAEAIAFCLAYQYRHDEKAFTDAQNKYLQPAKWVLSLENTLDHPEDAELEVALVTGGATKIKAYVFESARLPDIRGASGLLDRVNRAARQLWSSLGCEACVIYANGGEILAFAPVSEAARLADGIEDLFARETLVAQSVGVFQTFTLRQLRHGLLAGQAVNAEIAEQLLSYNPAENSTFGSLVAALAAARFRRREGNADFEGSRALRPTAHFETTPLARRCSSCERRAAVVKAPVSGDEEESLPLCEPCARKRFFGQRSKKTAHLEWWGKAQFEWKPDAGSPIEPWFEQFEEWLEKNPRWKTKYRKVDGKPLPEGRGINAVRDLNEIGLASQPQGFLGVVYADGNNMGAELERLKTPDEYADFAEAVYEANQTAVFKALAAYLCPQKVKREKGEILAHPFEILSVGGDDLFLIIPAHAALPIACAIARSVEKALLASDKERHRPLFRLPHGYAWEKAQRCRGKSPPRQCKVAVSAGVVLADAHTPIFYLQELAEELLKSAKRRAKWLKRAHRYYGGTVDFLSLKSVSMVSGSIKDFRKATMTRAGQHLFARPYTVEEMKALWETARILKKEKFPRTQLYRLRQSLRASREQGLIDYLYFLSRSEETRRARKEIEQLWPEGGDPQRTPWRAQLEDGKKQETIWLDLAEIYDFVPEKEGTNAGHAD